MTSRQWVNSSNFFSLNQESDNLHGHKQTVKKPASNEYPDILFTVQHVCIAQTMPWQDVCLFVCHTPVLTLNSYTYPQCFFIVG